MQNVDSAYELHARYFNHQEFFELKNDTLVDDMFLNNNQLTPQLPPMIEQEDQHFEIVRDSSLEMFEKSAQKQKTKSDPIVIDLERE